MNIKEYILKYNRRALSVMEAVMLNPRQVVQDQDCFEFDNIILIEGVYTKVLYYGKHPDEFIPVFELISFQEEDFKDDRSGLGELYRHYMKDCSVSQIDLLNPVQLSLIRTESLDKKKKILENAEN